MEVGYRRPAKVLAEKLRQNESELKECPVCGSAEQVLFAEIFAHPFFECRGCGHIFNKRPPLAEAVKALYTQDTLGEKSVQALVYAQKEIFQRRAAGITLPKARFVTARVPNKGGRWVDIGAGVGDLVAAAAQLGWDVVGLASDLTEVAFARSLGLEMEPVFVDEHNISEHVRAAAIVSLINVVEHIPAPGRLLKAISAGISSGAKVVIEVPRHPSLSSYANRHICAPDHLHIFTEQSLGILLEQAGLALQSIWLFGQDIYEVIMDMALQGGFGNDSLVNQLLLIVPETQQVIDRCGLADTIGRSGQLGSVPNYLFPSGRNAGKLNLWRRQAASILPGSAG